MLAVILSTATAESSDPAGKWKGTIQIPSTTLDVEVELVRNDDGSGAGTISIPAQGAKDLPLDVRVLESQTVTFAIRGIPGEPTFEGSLSEQGNRITGDFSQGTARFPFTLDRAVSAPAGAADILDELETTVLGALADFKVPGISIGIVSDGEVILERGYGLRNIAEDLPVTENTLFAIGSSTKAFTTATLGTLVDEGAVDWDTPVRDYLANFRLWDEHATAELTVRDLVTHRSGLPRHDLMWYGSDLDREALLQRLRYLQPYRDIREEWHYQNLMYLTAGVLTEELTGASWEETVRERILEPLKMERSNFSVEVSQEDRDHALPYREDDGEILAIPFRVIDTMGPAGSINSSAHEMLSWLQLHLDGGNFGGKRILNTSTLQEMHTPQMKVEGYPSEPDLLLGTYGLGWFIRAYRGHYQVEHGGNIDGFSALVSLYPLDDLGIVILVNANGSILPTLLERHIADRLLGLEPRAWLSEGLAEMNITKKAGKDAEARRGTTRVEGTKPAHPIEAYAGDYHHPAYGTMTVTLEGGQLTAVMHDISTPLSHWNYETFRGAEGEQWPSLDGLKFTFVTDEDGNIRALSVPLDVEVDAISFDRAVDRRLLDPDYLKKFAGTYHLEGAPQRLAIELRGTTLVLSVPGQPPLELEANAGGTFDLKGYAGFSVKFTEDADGVVTGLESRQSNGVFLASRVQE